SCAAALSGSAAQRTMKLKGLAMVMVCPVGRLGEGLRGLRVALSTAPHKPSVIKLTSAVHAWLLACRLPPRRRVMFLRRRRLIAASGLAAASAALPRLALGQSDRRPSLTIAVQQISNSASLEPTREHSNVGGRTFSFIFEALIMPNLLGQLEPVPGL